MCCKKFLNWVTFWKIYLVINVCNQGKTLCSPCIAAAATYGCLREYLLFQKLNTHEMGKCVMIYSVRGVKLVTVYSSNHYWVHCIITICATEVFFICQHACAGMKIAWFGGLSISFRIHLVLYMFRGIYHRRTIPFKQWEVQANKLLKYSMTTEDWNWIRPENVIDLENFFLSKKITSTTKKNVCNSKWRGHITVVENLTTVSIHFRVYI